MTGPFIPLPPAGTGAVERVWDGLARRLAAAGHRVTVLCRAHPTQLPDETIDGVLYRRRLHLRQTPHLALNLAKDLAYALTVLWNLPEADILVLNDTWSALLAPRLRKDAGRAVLNLQRMPKSPLIRPLYGGVERLVAVSEAVREAVKKMLPEMLPRTVVIGNCIHTDVFVPRSSPRQTAGERTILYTGRIHPEKGLVMLVSAFRLVSQRRKGLRLVLVGGWAAENGGGGAGFDAALRTEAEGLPVKFLPAVSDPEELSRLLQSAEVYCYPSVARTGETFGVAALEAAACGLPVVVSNLPCFREFARDGENAFVFDPWGPDPPAALAAALERALDLDSTERQRIASGARVLANGFSYETIAKKYEVLFLQLEAAR